MVLEVVGGTASGMTQEHAAVSLIPKLFFENMMIFHWFQEGNAEVCAAAGVLVEIWMLSKHFENPNKQAIRESSSSQVRPYNFKPTPGG